MQELFEGYRYFRKHTFPHNRELFENLVRQQHPHTLFITCSDSRIVPHLCTASLPGELFVVRNVANMIPPYESHSTGGSTIAGIEYAVKVLQVKNMVICGHSNCGGCRALLSDEASIRIPHAFDWVDQNNRLKQRLHDLYLPQEAPQQEDPYFFQTVEMENIIVQMENVRSYPFVALAEKSEELRIYGWHYDIGSGTILNYDKRSKKFEEII